MSTGSLAFASFMSSAAGRLLRIVAGLAFVAWGWTIHESTAGVILIALGVVAFLAGALNFCLIAPLIGAPFFGKPTVAGPRS